MSTRNGVLAAVVGVLVLIQLVPVDRSAPADEGPLGIEDPEVSALVEDACSDCHTNGTEWPWYSRVAPVSWWVAHHVEEGREHLNFSRWGALDLEDRDHVLEEMVEYVESHEMPLRSYTWGHPEARLTDAQRDLLVEWAERTRTSLGAPVDEEGRESSGAAGEAESS